MSNANRANPLAGIREESEVDNNFDSAEDSEEVMKDLRFLIHGFPPPSESSSSPDVAVIHQTDG